MITYIYWVRHAVSPFVPDAERERGLSEQGSRDAERVADLLEGEGIDVVAASCFRRAVDTVKPLAGRLGTDVLQFEHLNERLIASTKTEIGEAELLSAIERSFHAPDYCLPGGETTRQAQERAVPVVLGLLAEHRGRKIAVGTHGNIMTLLLSYFDSAYGYAFFRRTSKPDIYKAEFDDTRLVRVERLWEP